jgi:hypothetical protein
MTRSHAPVMTHLYVFKKKKNGLSQKNGIRAVSSRDIGKAEDRLVIEPK